MSVSMTFEEAVNRLQAMFDNMDQAVIAAVLADQGGNMDAAVMQLLEYSAAAPSPFETVSAAPVTSPPPSTSAGQPPSYPGPGPSQARNASQPHHSASQAEDLQMWRHPLPDSFLRVPRIAADGAGAGGGTMSQDELLSAMLQDEMYLAELRADPQFAAYLEAEQAYLSRASRPRRHRTTGGSSHTPAQSQHATPTTRTSQSTPSSVPELQHATSDGGDVQVVDDGPSLSDRLADMGADMKRKFASFALKFRQNQQRGTPVARGGTGQYRSLLAGGADEEDEDEGYLVGAEDDEEDRPPARAPVTSRRSQIDDEDGKLREL